MIHPTHPPIEISDSIFEIIAAGEWPGPPIPTIKIRGVVYALAGAHRMAACAKLGVAPQTIDFREVIENCGEDASEFFAALDRAAADGPAGGYKYTGDLLRAAGVFRDHQIAPAYICRDYGIDWWID